MTPLLYFTLLVICALSFGISMKIADLLDEHSLSLFRGADIVFGLLTGLFGGLLVLDNIVTANIIFAIYLGFLIRNKLDYLNHRLGASIIIIVYAAYSSFEPLVFFSCFLFINLGIDNVYDYLKKKKFKYYFVTELGLPIYALIYGFFSHEYTAFLVMVLYTLGYNGTKFFAAKYKID